MLRLRPRPAEPLLFTTLPVASLEPTNSQYKMTYSNIPRASIHVGSNKKAFSSQMGNEAERRGWDEKRYRLRNAETEKNNHYNYSRKHLNFEIAKGCKVMPLGTNPVPLHERLQMRHDELGFRPYMDAKRPSQIAKNSPNSLVNIIFGGDHEVMKELAFGNQEIDTSAHYADNSHIKLMPAITDWAKDTYRFCCRLWGEENIIGFDVHCDETGVHAHVLTVPVERVRKRGRIGSKYVHKNNLDKVLSTKEWKTLPKEERAYYIKSEQTKDSVERVSYAKVWGETAKDKSKYLSDLHTEYYNEVGCKYGLQRGIPYDELSPEERRGRRHKDKVTLEAERQAKLAIAEAEKLKANIEAETAIVTEQKKAAQKELKTAQSGFLAKIFQPGKYKNEEATRLKESYNAGVKEATNSFIKATGLKWNCEPTTTSLGQHFRIIWDTNKSLLQEHKSKDAIISEKEAKIKSLNAKVTTLTEEVDGLKYRLTLIDADAVDRLQIAKNAETARADKAESELRGLQSDYERLSNKWNEPEYNDAAKMVKARKEQEARLAEEAKREEQARENRRQTVIDSIVTNGKDSLRSFALTDRIDFNEQEAKSIYYGIMAIAQKFGFDLCTKNGVSSAVRKLLEGLSWNGCTNFRMECVTNWTKLFAENDNMYDSHAINNFTCFIDYMSCSSKTNVTTGGSNGCADQLTNWDGTQKIGLGALPKKKRGMSQ